VLIDELIFGYFTPDVILPVTSVVATVAGIFMMLGRGSYRAAARIIRRAISRLRRVATMNRPHFHVRTETPAEAKVSE
jgi:hypothetical protein